MIEILSRPCRADLYTAGTMISSYENLNLMLTSDLQAHTHIQRERERNTHTRTQTEKQRGRERKGQMNNTYRRRGQSPRGMSARLGHGWPRGSNYGNAKTHSFKHTWTLWASSNSSCHVLLKNSDLTSLGLCCHQYKQVLKCSFNCHHCSRKTLLEVLRSTALQQFLTLLNILFILGKKHSNPSV